MLAMPTDPSLKQNRLSYNATPRMPMRLPSLPSIPPGVKNLLLPTLASVDDLLLMMDSLLKTKTSRKKNPKRQLMLR